MNGGATQSFHNPPDLVFEDLLASGFLEGVELQCGSLIDGGNARVPDFHVVYYAPSISPHPGINVYRASNNDAKPILCDTPIYLGAGFPSPTVAMCRFEVRGGVIAEIFTHRPCSRAYNKGRMVDTVMIVQLFAGEKILLQIRQQRELVVTAHRVRFLQKPLTRNFVQAIKAAKRRKWHSIHK